ncbi:MAG: ABC transporter permease [Planctomycetota bacterium]|jgi:hypothetical protein
MDEDGRQDQTEEAQAGKPARKRRNLRAIITRYMPTLALAGKLRSPIFMKEMRAAFRRKRFFVAHTIALSVIGVVMLVSAFYYAEEGGDALSSAEVGKKLFYNFVLVQILLTCLVYPAFGCTSITDERANKSFDLLVTSNLQPWEIVYGKCLATFVYSSVFILTTIPFVWLSMLFGAITPGKIALTYFFLVLFSIVVTLLSVFISSMFENSAKGVITTYGAILFGALLLYFASDFFRDGAAATAEEGKAPAGIFGGVVASLEKFTGNFAPGSVKEHNRAYVFVYPVYFFFVFCAFFFILASNRLKPRAFNRSTSMKVFVVVFSVLILVIGFDHFNSTFNAKSLIALKQSSRQKKNYVPEPPEELRKAQNANLTNPEIAKWTRDEWLKKTWNDGKWNGPDGENQPYFRVNWEKYRLPDKENVCPNPLSSWKRIEKHYREEPLMLPSVRLWGLKRSRTMAALALFFLFVAVLFFSGESLVPSLRIRNKISRLTGWKRLLLPFAPGARNGVTFSLAWSAVILVAIALYFHFRSGLGRIDYEATNGDFRGWYSSIYFPLMFWIFLFFISQFTVFLTTGRSGPVYGKVFTFFAVLILTLTPVLPWAAKVDGHWWTGYTLSPISWFFSIWELPSGSSSEVQLVTGGVAVFVWSMLIYSAAGFSLMVLNQQRTTRPRTVRMYSPMNKPFSAPKGAGAQESPRPKESPSPDVKTDGAAQPA